MFVIRCPSFRLLRKIYLKRALDPACSWSAGESTVERNGTFIVGRQKRGGD
jgi:hypothetical protein